MTSRPAAFAATLVVALLAAAGGAAGTDPAQAPVKRPADLAGWVTVGTTLRMAPTDATAPNQFRHVQLEPRAYRALVKSGALPDGATFAVTFYSTRREAGETPTLYAPDKEFFFGLEVLDAKHPDGRRFYTFAPGATTATPLPAGNACAVCHNAKGSLQGTFAHDYPLMARFAKPRT
jgi:hypothetical protein